MTETTRQPQSTAVRTIYVAFELSLGKWRLAVTTDRRERARHYTVDGGDVTAALARVERARSHWGLPVGTAMVSCYEAGRDGFWLARCLAAHGVRTVVLDPTSIERDARAKHVKTDRLDAERLLALLIEGCEGRKRLREVRVPSVAEEDARQADRELAAAKRARTAITNRLTGLLITQGVRVCGARIQQAGLEAQRTWDGAALPAGLLARLTREIEERDRVTARIATLERERRQAIAAATSSATQQMAQLMRLPGIGANGASRLVVEFYGWRAFKNGREIGALAGLTPTPFASGGLTREQGISKAGHASVRAMAIELAWCWHRFQPASALSRWFDERFARGTKRQRRVGIVAVARKLLIALWRFLQTGELPEGAVVTAAA